MTTRLLKIEVCGTTVKVEGEARGTAKTLGVFPNGLVELQRVFARFGEPHETEQLDGRYIMKWRLDPKVIEAQKPRRGARGSGTHRPIEPDGTDD